MPRNIYKRAQVWWARVQIDGREVRRSLRTRSEDTALQRVAALLDNDVPATHPTRARRLAEALAQRGHCRDRPGGLVYFVQTVDGGPIKIGHTRNIEGRLKLLQTASAKPMRVLVAVPGTLADEAALHKHFDRERAIGEWFRASPRLKRFIATMARGDLTFVGTRAADISKKPKQTAGAGGLDAGF